MAENNITLTTLRRHLSRQTGVSEKVAGEFLDALFSNIRQGLLTDGEVLILELGTLSLQDVPERKSVNVVTGEPIILEARKKVVFKEQTATQKQAHQTPLQLSPQRGESDYSLRNDGGSVSGRATAGKAEIDPIKKLGEQAAEIKDILSELQDMPMSAQPIENKPTENESAENESAEIVTSAGPAPVEPAATVPDHTDSADIEPEQVAPTKTEEQQSKAAPFNPLRTGLITILVFALLLVAAYFFLRHRIVNWADGMRQNIEQKVTVAPTTTQESTSPPTTPNPSLEVRGEKSEEKSSDENELVRVDAKSFPILTIETVGQDSRLAWIAYKYYGEKALWVYIYEVNRDQLKSPAYVLPGMKLRIPDVPKQYRDLSNPQVKALLEQKAKDYQ